MQMHKDYIDFWRPNIYIWYLESIYKIIGRYLKERSIFLENKVQMYLCRGKYAKIFLIFEIMSKKYERTSMHLAYTSQLSSTTSFRAELQKLLHIISSYSPREPTNSRAREPTFVE